MFIGEYGICQECEKNALELGITPVEKWIVIKRPYLCKFHNEQRKKGYKKWENKNVSKITTVKKRKSTGEAELFKQIWEKQPHKCTGCGIKLGDEAKSFHFSHILKKGTYPKLRLDPDNILLECFHCHSKWENGSIEQKRGMKNFHIKLKYIQKHAKLLFNKLTQNQNENN